MFERLKRWLQPAKSARPEASTPNDTAPARQRPTSVGLPGPLVIDVRSEREFQATAIEHAVNVPLPQLAHRIAEIATEKATPLVLYCASGARSGSGCQTLKQLGYTDVTNAGGLYAAAAYLQREVRRCRGSSLSMANRTPDGLAAEWAGRLLVTLQFGLLALMGWRAWVRLPSLEILAGALVFASAGLALWTLAVNRPGNFNIRPAPRIGGTLVTSGPYRWIRHPMYTSVLLAAAAAAVMSNQLLDVLLWFGLLTVLVVKAGIEERALMDRFPSYLEYRTHTTRFVPWLV